jgi:hypothetical protein
MQTVSLLLLVTSSLLAQGNAVIFGTVTDQSGAVLSQAEVTATNEATGTAETVKSNTAGNYIFPDLGPGTYKLTSQVPGFETTEHRGVVVEVERRVRLDISMQVGEV